MAISRSNVERKRKGNGSRRGGDGGRGGDGEDGKRSWKRRGRGRVLVGEE